MRILICKGSQILADFYCRSTLGDIAAELKALGGSTPYLVFVDFWIIKYDGAEIILDGRVVHSGGYTTAMAMRRIQRVLEQNDNDNRN